MSEKETTAIFLNDLKEKVRTSQQSAFPSMKGFSLSNLKYMRQFAECFLQQQISQLLASQFQSFNKRSRNTGLLYALEKEI